MTSSPSRMIRPRSFWGSAVAALALTCATSVSAQDAAAPAEKPAPPPAAKKGASQPGATGPKAPGMKGLMEARKEKLAGEKGEPRGPVQGQTKGAKAHPPGKGHEGKPGQAEHKGKQKPAVTPKVARGRYDKALEQLQEAEAAAASASPEEAEKAKKAVQAAQRSLRRAQRDIRQAHRGDAMKMLQMKPDDRKKLDTKLQSRAKTLAADRKARSQKRQDDLKKELGEKVKLAPVREELQLHAWRVARLERLAAIAEAAGRADAAKRAKELLEKEMAAHPLRLKKAAAGAKAGAAAPKVPVAGGAVQKTAATPSVPAKPAAAPAVPAKPAALPPKEAAQ